MRIALVGGGTESDQNEEMKTARRWRCLEGAGRRPSSRCSGGLIPNTPRIIHVAGKCTTVKGRPVPADGLERFTANNVLNTQRGGKERLSPHLTRENVLKQQPW